MCFSLAYVKQLAHGIYKLNNYAIITYMHSTIHSCRKIDFFITFKGLGNDYYATLHLS